MINLLEIQIQNWQEIGQAKMLPEDYVTKFYDVLIFHIRKKKYGGNLRKCRNSKLTVKSIIYQQ